MIRIFLISLSTMLLTASCKTIPSLPTQTDCERPGPNRPAHCPKTCQNDRDRPFLIGLEPSDMMDLENLIANQKGLVAQYERCGKFRILTRCSIDGAYEVNKNQPRAQSLEINSASTLEANLPLSVGQLSAKVSSGAGFKLSYVATGTQRFSPSVQATPTGGARCRDGTHFVESLYLGASLLQETSSSGGSASAGLGSTGVEGNTQNTRSEKATQGNPTECAESGLTDRCQYPLQVQLRALSELNTREPVQQNVQAPVATLSAGQIASGEAAGGVSWAKLEGGRFQIGSRESRERDERPVRPVALADFWLSRTEVTVSQYKRCVDAGVCTAPKSGGYCNWGQRGRAEHPINCVDWSQARTFARWVGGDLPTEAQWEFAARSRGDRREFPWGSSVPSCELAIIDGKRRGSAGEQTDGCGEDRTWPVCSRRAGNTEQGLCDLIGNVQEWTLDEYLNSYNEMAADGAARCSGAGCEGATSKRVLRGGHWYVDQLPRLRAGYRNFLPGNRRAISVGFRVARQRPPTHNAPAPDGAQPPPSRQPIVARMIKVDRVSIQGGRFTIGTAQ
ncbi:MAG: formylglycine-generating enzyme family protein, partial [Myxococcota bacterium]|nr:formylglycine-generating enzyme family protein [Myxococcota bacterium]